MPLLIALFGALMAALGRFSPDGGGGGDAGAGGDGAGSGSGVDSARNAGGTGDGGDGDGDGAGEGDGNGDGDGAGAGEGDGQDPAQRGTKLTDPAALQRELDDARRQAAGERTKRTDAETARNQALEAFKPIAKMLGFDTGEDPDPAQLQAKLEQTQAALRAERINNAFYRVASQADANPELTLRYLRGGNELEGLDPDKDDFEASLKAIVQAAISSTPALKAAPQAGGSFDGGARGGGTPAEPDDLAGLIAQRVSQQRRTAQA
jgi:hypothetical protein